MDRTVYLKKCQKLSVLKEERHTKKGVPIEEQICVNGFMYYPEAYRMSFDNEGEPVHTAILHSVDADVIIGVPLDKI